MLRTALFVVALVGCAKGGVGQLAPGDGNEVVIDGKVYQDGPDMQRPDAKIYQDAHVYMDAHEFHDAHVYMDAHEFTDAHVYMDACVPVQTELLTNGGFESGPGGGWHEVDPEGELIVQPGTGLTQAGTWGDWQGSYDHAQTDELFQDVAVPVGTTSLVLTGYWLVGTQETSTTNAYDFGTVALVQPTGETVIESALALNNLNAGPTTFTAFDHSFAVAGVAGTTVRLKIGTTSDVSNLTNFFFDTLSLTATHCP